MKIGGLLMTITLLSFLGLLLNSSYHVPKKLKHFFVDLRRNFFYGIYLTKTTVFKIPATKADSKI